VEPRGRERRCGGRRAGAPRPVALRAALFGAAAASAGPRAAVEAEVAARLGVTPDALARSLFADLPGEREVRAPDPIPTPPRSRCRRTSRSPRPW
jgi:predicted nuclease of restriction endonuclease-like RecB superfamily